MPNQYTPNEQRGNDKNHNNPAYQAGLDNRSQQLDPQNPKYNGGSGKSEDGKKK